MELWKGSSEALLKALHILTRDGKLNADSRRKLKQVQHLSQFIEPLIQKIATQNADFTVVDMGAGKSYLGFILYDLVLRRLGTGRLLSIETRPELIEKSKQLAKDSQFDRMHFLNSTIQAAKISGDADLVCALHACDTATDDAILFGIRHHAKAFALVPCCQAEVAQLLKQGLKESESQELLASRDVDLKSLFEFPLHRREFGSHLTNVIRVLFLQSQGYQVTVTELIGWEHSMKNELILAEKVSDLTHPKSVAAKNQLDQLLARFKIQPLLLQS